MKFFAATLASLVLIGSPAQAQETKAMPSKSTLTREDIRAVAPALEKYAHDHLFGDVWKRPGLTARDRSNVTISALIASLRRLRRRTASRATTRSGAKARVPV